MAGMVPGVGVPHRRRLRTDFQYHQQDHSTPNNYYNYYAHPSSTASSQEPSMDETTLRARQRLHEKLGSLCPTRLNKTQESGHNHASPTKHSRLSLKGGHRSSNPTVLAKGIEDNHKICEANQETKK